MSETDDDEEFSPFVRAVGAVDKLDGMYQLLIFLSIVAGVGSMALGAYLVGLVWLLGGPAFVFGVQRWED